MLLELHIKNIAIIEEQSLEFGEGFNVISGETGAGKSIILQSLDLVLGGKPSPRLVRSGAREGQVTALLEVEAGLLAEFPEYSEADEVVITRTVPVEGRSKISINGRPATAQLLQEVASRLITICGQNQHARLLEPRFHVALVDDFAGNGPLREEYLAAFQMFAELDSRLNEMRRRASHAEIRREELGLIIADLEAVSPKEGQRGELESEITRLSNGEKILTIAERIRASLSGSSGMTDSVHHTGGATGMLENLKRVEHDLAALIQIDVRLKGLDDLFNSALVSLSEFESEIDRYAASVDLNGDALDGARETLANLARVERKYKTNEQGLLALLKSARDELEDLGDDASLEVLARQSVEARNSALEWAERLSHSRMEAGARLSSIVERELSEVNMPKARLELERQAAELGPSGIDTIQFLFSGNKGEPLRALREIASGGELSRLMLVLKKVLRDRSGVSVLVFDEVDTGISGKVARAVGEKLRNLAQDSQVICITHLAQVASLADRHFLVEKLESDRTLARVRPLDPNERIDEIARMLAGFEITAAARESARELIVVNG